MLKLRNLTFLWIHTMDVWLLLQMVHYSVKMFSIYFISYISGLVVDNYVVEVKCLHSVSKLNLNLEEAAKTENICLELDGGELILKENHNYFYQIQSQLNISRRQFCYFVVFVNENVEPHTEIIERNQVLMENDMLPRLLKFYNECFAQEIVRGRILKYQTCYDPPSITTAQEALKNKKHQKSKENATTE